MPVNNKTKMCQYKILLMDPIMSQFSPFHTARIELLRIRFCTYCILSIKILNISMFTFKLHIHFKDPSSIPSLEYETCQYIYTHTHTHTALGNSMFSTSDTLIQGQFTKF